MVTGQVIGMDITDTHMDGTITMALTTTTMVDAHQLTPSLPTPPIQDPSQEIQPIPTKGRFPTTRRRTTILKIMRRKRRRKIMIIIIK